MITTAMSPSPCVINMCKNIGNHRFPKNEQRKAEWIQAIQTWPGVVVRTHSLICSAHFRRCDFALTPTFWTKGDRAAKVLKRTAVPSIFPWSPITDPDYQEPTSSPFDGICREQAKLADMCPARIDCEPDINVVLKTEPEDDHEDTVHSAVMGSGSSGIKREIEIEIDFNVKKEQEEVQEDKGYLPTTKDCRNVSIEIDRDVEGYTPKCTNQSDQESIVTTVTVKQERAETPPVEEITLEGHVTGQTVQDPKLAEETSIKRAPQRDPLQTDEKAHQCKVCHKQFGWSSKLKEHMRKHTGERPYPCNVCQRPFGRKSSLKIHFKNHSDDIYFECNICSNKYAAEEEFNSHVESHTEKRYKCDVCQSRYEEKSDLNNHLKTHTGKQPFKCNICQIKFVQKINLQMHLKSHTGKTFQCKICYIPFNQRANLLKHISKHTNDGNVYVCDHCQHKFSEKSALRKHIRTHTGEKPFKCNICHLRFSQKINLQTHSRTHTGEKPYECNFCKKRFSRIHCLQIHVRTHTGEKPYECNMCEMRFARKAHMTAHVRIHTGEKPYECDVCKKRFTENSGLRKHYRTHTGEKPYECNYCECRFSNTKSLKVHACRETISQTVMVPTLPEMASSIGDRDPLCVPAPL